MRPLNRLPGNNHFDKKIVKALGAKNIHIIGIQAIPDDKGSFLNSTTGYILNDNGTQKIRSYMQVKELAK